MTKGVEATEAHVQAVTGHKPGHRVTFNHIKSLVVEEEFHRPNHTRHMTICTLKLKNGFVVLGTSTPADPDKYDSSLGAQLAYDDALRKVWPLEGYLLRERLSRGNMAGGDPELGSATENDEGSTVKMGTAVERNEATS